jgi:hypothetical protein
LAANDRAARQIVNNFVAFLFRFYALDKISDIAYWLSIWHLFIVVHAAVHLSSLCIDHTFTVLTAFTFIVANKAIVLALAVVIKVVVSPTTNIWLKVKVTHDFY